MPSLVQRLEKRGFEKAQRQTALEMLKNGFELGDISDIVKIPLIELKKMASTLR